MGLSHSVSMINKDFGWKCKFFLSPVFYTPSRCQHWKFVKAFRRWLYQTVEKFDDVYSGFDAILWCWAQCDERADRCTEIPYQCHTSFCWCAIKRAWLVQVQLGQVLLYFFPLMPSLCRTASKIIRGNIDLIYFYLSLIFVCCTG